MLVHNACKNDIKQINQAAKKLGFNGEMRRAYGDYIESMKDGIPNNRNFTWKQLLEYGKQFKEFMNEK